MITSHEPTLREYLIGICHKTKRKRTWNTRIGKQKHQEGKSVHIFKIAIYNQNPKQFLLVSCSAPPPEWRFNADYLRLVPQDTEGILVQALRFLECSAEQCCLSVSAETGSICLEPPSLL